MLPIAGILRPEARLLLLNEISEGFVRVIVKKLADTIRLRKGAVTRS